jgi:nucleoside phosphorylase
MSNHDPQPVKKPFFCMVIALPAEARPLNHHFGLIRDNSLSPFPLYRNANLALAISGVGCNSAYRTACWLNTHIRTPQRCGWLNIGIAGHPSRPIGQAVLAREIRDDTGTGRWLAHLPTVSSWDSDLLISRSEPESDYPCEALYDMEAAGFFRAASRFAPPGLIHSLKIISDNREHPATGLSGKQVSCLIREQLNTVERLLQQLGACRT